MATRFGARARPSSTAEAGSRPRALRGAGMLWVWCLASVACSEETTRDRVEVDADIDYNTVSENATVSYTATFNKTDDDDGDDDGNARYYRCHWRPYKADTAASTVVEPSCVESQCTCNFEYVYDPGCYEAVVKLWYNTVILVSEGTCTVSVESSIAELQMFPLNLTKLITGRKQWLRADPGPDTTGAVNFTWHIENAAQENDTSVTSNFSFIHHVFKGEGNPTVTAVAANSRGTFTSVVQYSVFNEVNRLTLSGPASGVQANAEFNVLAVSPNATEFVWSIVDADIDKRCDCRNLTFSLNETGGHNVTVTAGNAISSVVESMWIEVNPPPTPKNKYVQAAEIGTPIVVAGIIVIVAVASFASHRWYVSRKGVETANFDFSMGVDIRQPRRKTLVGNIKQTLLNRMSPSKGRRVYDYGSLNDDL